MRTLKTLGVSLVILPSALLSQNRTRAADVSVPDSARPAARDLRGLRWRLVGPFRGGRAVARKRAQTHIRPQTLANQTFVTVDFAKTGNNIDLLTE